MMLAIDRSTSRHWLAGVFGVAGARQRAVLAVPIDVLLNERRV